MGKDCEPFMQLKYMVCYIYSILIELALGAPFVVLINYSARPGVT